jgi:hypothetical protein
MAPRHFDHNRVMLPRLKRPLPEDKETRFVALADMAGD